MIMKEIIGRVHSVETLGTRDGPGLRCVFFLAGCNFRCSFCQNPDTWTQRGSERMNLNEARERLETLLPYLRQGGGGVTVSGGEPSQQPDFVQALFKTAHELGLNTALDTNGACAPARRHDLLSVTDIVLMDIKAMDEKLHLKVTGRRLAPVLVFGRLAAAVPGRLTIRRVLLPGINDSARELESLAEYALELPNQPEIELIAYHRLGVHKWKELGMRYSLAKLAPPKPAQWRRAAERLRKRGLVVHQG